MLIRYKTSGYNTWLNDITDHDTSPPFDSRYALQPQWVKYFFYFGVSGLGNECLFPMYVKPQEDSSWLRLVLNGVQAPDSSFKNRHCFKDLDASIRLGVLYNGGNYSVIHFNYTVTQPALKKALTALCGNIKVIVDSFTTDMDQVAVPDEGGYDSPTHEDLRQTSGVSGTGVVYAGAGLTQTSDISDLTQNSDVSSSHMNEVGICLPRLSQQQQLALETRLSDKGNWRGNNSVDLLNISLPSAIASQGSDDEQSHNAYLVNVNDGNIMNIIFTYFILL